MKWHSKSYHDVIAALESSKESGLGERQAKSKQDLYGMNSLAEKKKTSIVVKFFMQFNDFMIITLLAAAAASLFVSIMHHEADFIDPIIILLIVVVNAILGLVQESKAEKALEALKNMAAPTSKVIRDGKLLHISTIELVPGDIIMLETGDFIPADARLITSINLKAEESALTGESLPVEKDAELILKEDALVSDRRNMVFTGSSISYGRGLAIVCETGMSTEVGKIANMILEDDTPETPLQKKLANTGKQLGIGALAICFVIFVVGLLKQIPPFEMFMTSVSLAVAAIPEGLPAIVTIMLAIGVQQMSKRNAIIRKLPAVETLGSATVICSDKTGTLTQNKMKVIEVWDSNGVVGSSDHLKKHILKLATLCNDSILEEQEGKQNALGDPTETALVMAALNLDIDKNITEKEMPRVGEVPFDSKRKLMSTVHKSSANEYLIITKGAPDVLIDRCTHYYENGKAVKLNPNRIKEILANNSKMAERALRVLAVAYKEAKDKPYKNNSSTIENNLVFAGLIGMIDPPREEAKQAVETCRMAGIKAVMVTGDHIITAKAIAKKLGMFGSFDKAISGEELNNLSQEELIQNINSYTVFARVTPEHKARIVKAFQANGEVVAMTGDGVNDAPALKTADIGCAMGISGTDVAKGAADMVLTDDNFATIVEAVRIGRGIYSNIRKSVHFLLSSNIGEIITILTALLMGWATPLLAIHLLWVNLVTDSLPAIAIGLEPTEKDIMTKKPFDNTKNLFSNGLWMRIGMEGIMIGMLAILAFGIGHIYFDRVDSHVIGRTMAFATLSISELVHAFNMRSEKSIFAIDFFENKYLIGAFFIGLFLQVTVIMLPGLARIFKVYPLGATQWLIVLVLCIMPLVIVEIEKYFSGSEIELEQKPKRKLISN